MAGEIVRPEAASNGSDKTIRQNWRGTAEGLVWQNLGRRFQILRNGWPDFMVLSNRGVPLLAIEVKGPGDEVSPEQHAMHNALRGLGVEVQVLYTEAGGIRRCVRELTQRFYPKPPRFVPTLQDQAEHQTWLMGLFMAAGLCPPVFPPIDLEAETTAFDTCRSVL